MGLNEPGGRDSGCGMAGTAGGATTPGRGFDMNGGGNDVLELGGTEIIPRVFEALDVVGAPSSAKGMGA